MLLIPVINVFQELMFSKVSASHFPLHSLRMRKNLPSLSWWRNKGLCSLSGPTQFILCLRYHPQPSSAVKFVVMCPDVASQSLATLARLVVLRASQCSLWQGNFLNFLTTNGHTFFMKIILPQVSYFPDYIFVSTIFLNQ